jgi:hypothetical protein
MKLFAALAFLTFCVCSSGYVAWMKRVEIFLSLRALMPMDHIRFMADWLPNIGPYMGAVLIVVILWGEWR